jgi:hypothetical protein
MALQHLLGAHYSTTCGHCLAESCCFRGGVCDCWQKCGELCWVRAGALGDCKMAGGVFPHRAHRALAYAPHAVSSCPRAGRPAACRSARCGVAPDGRVLHARDSSRPRQTHSPRLARTRTASPNSMRCALNSSRAQPVHFCTFHS